MLATRASSSRGEDDDKDGDKGIRAWFDFLSVAEDEEVDHWVSLEEFNSLKEDVLWHGEEMGKMK